MKKETLRQMGSVHVEELARKVVGAMPALDATEQRVAVQLYRLVAEGQPVSPVRLAERVGLPARRVAKIVDKWPGVFSDERGDVVAFWGLAQPKMPHRFRVDGRQLYTWCAWDTLFIPQILGKSARVESSCPTTGHAVSLTVSPDEVKEVSPRSAVLSFLRPEEAFDGHVIERFCHYVLFFASEDAGRRWTSEHANTFLMSIEEGFELGRLTNRGKYGAVLVAVGSGPP